MCSPIASNRSRLACGHPICQSTYYSFSVNDVVMNTAVQNWFFNNEHVSVRRPSQGARSFVRSFLARRPHSDLASSESGLALLGLASRDMYTVQPAPLARSGRRGSLQTIAPPAPPLLLWDRRSSRLGLRTCRQALSLLGVPSSIPPGGAGAVWGVGALSEAFGRVSMGRTT